LIGALRISWSIELRLVAGRILGGGQRAPGADG
jgi:hypothetical protein